MKLKALATVPATWGAVAGSGVFSLAGTEWLGWPLWLGLTNAAGCIGLWILLTRMQGPDPEDIRRRREERERGQVEKLEALQEALVGHGWRTAAQQVDAVQRKRRALESVLAQRISGQGLRGKGYRGAAEEVAGTVVDNLFDARTALDAAAGIDVERCRHRLGRMAAQGAEGEEAEKERSALEARLALHAEQTGRVEALLRENEVMLTQLDEATAAVAGSKGKDRMATVEAETAMDALRALAKRSRVEHGRRTDTSLDVA